MNTPRKNHWVTRLREMFGCGPNQGRARSKLDPDEVWRGPMLQILLERDRVAIEVSRDTEERFVRAFGRVFVESEHFQTGFAGFYDWMRTPGGLVRGVRVLLLNRLLLKDLPTDFPQVAISRYHVVFWFGEPDASADGSDQEIGVTRLFVHRPSNAYLLSIAAVTMEDSELEELARTKEWSVPSYRAR